MKTNKTLIFALILIISLVSQFSNAQPSQTWVQHYNGVNSMSDKATAVAIDNNCNVYVTGQSDKLGAGINYLTIKYDDEGNTIWAVEYDGPAHLDDIPNAIKVDANGNVYITGKSASASNGFDFLTVKYNSSGTEQWASRFNSASNSDDVASDLAIDVSGNVYVCGNEADKYGVMVKYNSSGTQLWTYADYNIVEWYDHYYKVKISNSGAIEVLGEHGLEDIYQSYSKIYLYHYTSNGKSVYEDTNWNSTFIYMQHPVDFILNSNGDAFICGYSSEYPSEYIFILSTTNLSNSFASYIGSGTSNSRPSTIRLDNSGNVYLCGYTDINSGSAEDLNYLAIKYNSGGTQQWLKTFGATGEDKAIDMAFGSGSSPDIYIMGYTTNTAGNKDITTLKYNNNGVLQSNWTQTHNGPTNEDDLPVGIKTDAYNNVLLAGYSGALNAEDYTTIKYINNSFSPVITWSGLNTFTATAGTSYQWYFNNSPVNGATQQSINIASTGNGNYYCMVSQYCYTYMSNTASGCFVGLQDNPDVLSASVYPNPNPGNFTITFQLQPNHDGYLEIYNTTGNCIYKSQLPISSTTQQIRLSNMANGVYNCVITSGNSRISRKIVVLK